jgi:hypothetical protein
MIIFTKYIGLTILVAFVVTLAWAADTNEIFLPLDLAIHSSKASAASSYEQQVHAAMPLPESRPAALDPGGHWGNVVSGLQMSVRLDKKESPVGQPVTVTVIVRNVTTNAIKLFSPTRASIGLVVKDSNDVEIPTPQREVSVFGPMEVLLPGHRQIRYQFPLGGYARLTSPGTYTIQAKRRAPETAAGTASSLRSACATIRIL